MPIPLHNDTMTNQRTKDRNGGCGGLYCELLQVIDRKDTVIVRVDAEILRTVFVGIFALNDDCLFRCHCSHHPNGDIGCGGCRYNQL